MTKQITSPRTHSLPTPAHSINDSMSSTGLDRSQEDLSNKRKRDAEDTGDRDQKKVYVEDGRLRLEDLHLDVGKKYKLCHTPHPPTVPDLKDDLFARYGLEDVAKSVARTNPDGSKGVKLRKTYKNHIKEHQLSGNFDSIRKEMDAPDTLFAIMIAPAEEWDNEYTHGKEIENGLPISVNQLMGKALKMARGPIPRASWNNSVLGELITASAPIEVARALQGASKPHSLPNPAVGRIAKSDVARPKRSVKKRTYGDSSYEGYGEGYVDDDTQENGYSTGDGESLSRKRVKKSAQAHGFQGPPTRHNSYGPGMVGA